MGSGLPSPRGLSAPPRHVMFRGGSRRLSSNHVFQSCSTQYHAQQPNASCHPVYIGMFDQHYKLPSLVCDFKFFRTKKRWAPGDSKGEAALPPSLPVPKMLSNHKG